MPAQRSEGNEPVGGRAERWAARLLIGRYHEEQLGLLLERVREGFDAFELDELIHRYKRSARELWKFCGQSGSGWLSAATPGPAGRSPSVAQATTSQRLLLWLTIGPEQKSEPEGLHVTAKRGRPAQQVIQVRLCITLRG